MLPNCQSTSVIVIASCSQASTQLSHPMHSSSLTGTDFSSCISKTSTGQILIHSSHPVHFSLSTSTLYMSQPPFVLVYLRESIVESFHPFLKKCQAFFCPKTLFVAFFRKAPMKNSIRLCGGSATGGWFALQRLWEYIGKTFYGDPL